MDTVKQVPLIVHHPKSPGAGPEQLRRLAGIIELQGPVPSTKFLDDALAEQAARHAGE